MLNALFRTATAVSVLLRLGFSQCSIWDPGFAVPGLGNKVFAFEVFDDGFGPALYAGGTFLTAGSVPAKHIAKWNGASWSGVGFGMEFGLVYALEAFDDGSGTALFVGGAFNNAGGVHANSIAKWNGTSWSPLGNGMNNAVLALAVFDYGTGPALYAGGYFSTAGSVVVEGIAKWNGTSWSPLGSGVRGNCGCVYALEVFDDGSGPALYVGGFFDAAGSVPASYIARWDGSSWSTVGGSVDGDVYALEVFDDGSGPALYAGGAFNFAGGAPASRIAKWDGTSWSALGGAFNDSVRSLDTIDDGSGPALYAGGEFAATGGSPGNFIAKWDGANWSALGSGMSGAEATEYPVYALRSFDDGSGPAVYAGGFFTRAGGVPAHHVARWNGASWSALWNGQGIEFDASALDVYDDGSGPALYVAGAYTPPLAQSQPRIARWDGTSWSQLGSGLSGASWGVLDLVVFDDGTGPALYAGGGFLTAGGAPVNRIARWDGVNWLALDTGVDDAVTALAVFDDGSGTALYAGGFFTAAGAVPANRIARWDGTSWSALGSGLNGAVRALGVFDDGLGPALYAAGDFTSAGGVPANYVAKWEGTSWTALGNGTSSSVYALAVFSVGSGPALYAAGRFLSAGGAPANRIAMWDGASWSPLGDGVGGPGASSFPVYALTVFDDGLGPALYAGGDFWTAGGVDVNRIAKWNGASWSSLGSGLDSEVLALVAFDDGQDGDADLFVGGKFTVAGPVASNRIAQWHGCANDPVSFCFGDGTGLACPCNNTGLPGYGCENSATTGGGLLQASGTLSPETMVLTQLGEIATSLSIFLQGDQALATPVNFGDGVRCIGGNLLRLYVKSATAGTVTAPQPGDPPISARSAALGDPLVPGSTRHYQVYYRDPDLAYCSSPSGDSFNVGGAVSIGW